MATPNKNSNQQKCRPGSEERNLDMCETGPFKSEELLHSDEKGEQDVFKAGYRVDLSEEKREGDEESGDEHSSGYEGDDEGLGGNVTDQEEKLLRQRRGGI